MKQLLSVMESDARRYYAAEWLPGARELQSEINAKPVSLEEWSPLEVFFLLELSDDLWRKADPETILAAYTAGMLSLPTNWWGDPGYPSTPAAQNLISRISPKDLLPLLNHPQPLSFKGSEATTLSKEFHWTIGDLVAGFIATGIGEEYDSRKPIIDRKGRRAELKGLVTG